MQIQKVFNNNVVLVTDENQQESIVVGKGIGFQKKTGDSIDEINVEKRFVLQDEEMTTLFSNIYKNMSGQQSEVVFSIIKIAETTLKQSYQTHLFITLADHIGFAIERHEKGLIARNPLSNEVRKFYPDEYAVGLQALSLIKKQLNVTLAEDEAASIALHIVNASQEGSHFERTVQITKIVQDIIEIVRLHFGRELDENDFSYSRFITHLQYFAQRILSGSIEGINDSFLFEQVQANYPNPFACTEKICGNHISIRHGAR